MCCRYPWPHSFSLFVLALQRLGLKSRESLWPSVAKLFLPSFALAMSQKDMPGGVNVFFSEQ